MKTYSSSDVPSLRSLTLAGIGGVAFALACPTAPASVVTFIGSDPGAGPTDPKPNSNVAASNFDTIAGGFSQVTFFTFENEPVGPFTSLSLGSGVTLTGTNVSGASQNILDAPDYSPAPSLGGYNTTFGGLNYVDMQGGTVTFTFSTPIVSFGAYFTGVQDFNPDTLTFNDGASETVTIPSSSNSSGGVSFVGFTDAGHSFSSVTVTASGGGYYDAIGVDDVRFSFAPVPEPSAGILLVGAGAALAGWLHARRAQTA